MILPGWLLASVINGHFVWLSHSMSICVLCTCFAVYTTKLIAYIVWIVCHFCVFCSITHIINVFCYFYIVTTTKGHHRIQWFKNCIYIFKTKGKRLKFFVNSKSQLYILPKKCLNNIHLTSRYTAQVHTHRSFAYICHFVCKWYSYDTGARTMDWIHLTNNLMINGW